MSRAVPRRSRAHAGPLLALTAIALAAASCASVPRTLQWRVEFGTSALRGRTSTVVARVLEGGCDGDALFETRIRASDTTMASPPLLSPGRYGLAAFAIDEGCALVAADCREVILPSEGEVTLLLNDEADAPACPRDVCSTTGCADRAEYAGGVPAFVVMAVEFASCKF